jgi:hypothetical protein
VRCEVGRVPFRSLLHRPEDDGLPVAPAVDPFNGETYPMCTECRRFLEGEAEDYAAWQNDLYRDQFR